MKTWIVEYKDFDDLVNGAWTHHDRYPNDQDGAYSDYMQLKQAFVHVRIGYEETKIVWQEGLS